MLFLLWARPLKQPLPLFLSNLVDDLTVVVNPEAIPPTWIQLALFCASTTWRSPQVRNGGVRILGHQAARHLYSHNNNRHCQAEVCLLFLPPDFKNEIHLSIFIKLDFIAFGSPKFLGKLLAQLCFCNFALNSPWDPCPIFVDTTSPTWKVNGPQCKGERGTVGTSATCNLSFLKDCFNFPHLFELSWCLF